MSYNLLVQIYLRITVRYIECIYEFPRKEDLNYFKIGVPPRLQLSSLHHLWDLPNGGYRGRE